MGAGMDQPMGTDPMFATRQGEPITRESVCECGASFIQRLLSERFLAMVIKHSSTALAVFEAQVPDGYVPVHCLPCEHHDLIRQYALDKTRDKHPTDAPYQNPTHPSQDSSGSTSGDLWRTD